MFDRLGREILTSDVLYYRLSQAVFVVTDVFMYGSMQRNEIRLLYGEHDAPGEDDCFTCQPDHRNREVEVLYSLDIDVPLHFYS
jgi:hypothetical protein